MNNNIYYYFLSDKMYNGEVYIISDNTQKYGFSCFADSEYKCKLDVREIDKSSIKTYKNNICHKIYQHNTCIILCFSLFLLYIFIE